MITRSRRMIIGFIAAWMAVIPFLAHGQSQKASPETRAQGATAVAAGPTYMIGPGDLLDIDVWKNQELTFKGLPVRPDGKISFPLLNDVQAAGLTAMQLASKLTAMLKAYVKDPEVTVVVAQVNSQRYYVLGEVTHPGVYPLLPGITTLQAISAAGGFTQFANEKKIYILRGSQKLPFNYKMVVQGKDLQENIELKPGDTIVIP